MNYYFVKNQETGRLAHLPPSGQLEFLIHGNAKIAPPSLDSLRQLPAQASLEPEEEINRQFPPARNQDPHYRETIYYNEVIKSANWPENPNKTPSSLQPATKTLPPHQLFLPSFQ